MGEKGFKYILRAFYGFLICLGLYVGGKLLLPWLAPFLLAWAAAVLMEPAVRAMTRRGSPRGAAAGIMTLSFLAVIGWTAVQLLLWTASKATDLALMAPELMGLLLERGESLRAWAEAIAQQAPEGTGKYILSALDALGESLYALPSLISQWGLDMLAATAQRSPDILLFAVTAGIGTYFISASYPQTRAFLLCQLPLGLRQRLRELREDMRGSWGGFFKAQLILMGATFFQLLVGFYILDIEDPLAMALLTALIDALPVFGTGIVLGPWAVYSLLLGREREGLGLLLLWAIVSLVRSCTQAKLLGDQIGLDPLASLLAVYVGWKVWGVWGMLSFPMLLVALKQLNDRGAIHLWKTL